MRCASVVRTRGRRTKPAKYPPPARKRGLGRRSLGFAAGAHDRVAGGYDRPVDTAREMPTDLFGCAAPNDNCIRNRRPDRLVATLSPYGLSGFAKVGSARFSGPSTVFRHQWI